MAPPVQSATVQANYPFNIRFDGLDAAQVLDSGQSWNLGELLTGWNITVHGRVNQSNVEANALGIELFNSNQSLPIYRNPDFPDASGIYVRNVPNELDLRNITISFSFTFSNVNSSLASLGLFIFSGESVDAERDTLSHSNGDFKLVSNRNLNPSPSDNNSDQLAGVIGENSPEITFRESTGRVAQNGGYTVTTDVTDGDTITWTYDYLGPLAQRGANMIGISASGLVPPDEPGGSKDPGGPAPVPVPAGILLYLTGALGLLGYSRIRELPM